MFSSDDNVLACPEKIIFFINDNGQQRHHDGVVDEKKKVDVLDSSVPPEERADIGPILLNDSEAGRPPPCFAFHAP